jgi:hypothetical protein
VTGGGKREEGVRLKGYEGRWCVGVCLMLEQGGQAGAASARGALGEACRAETQSV